MPRRNHSHSYHLFHRVQMQTQTQKLIQSQGSAVEAAQTDRQSDPQTSRLT